MTYASASFHRPTNFAVGGGDLWRSFDKGELLRSVNTGQTYLNATTTLTSARNSTNDEGHSGTRVPSIAADTRGHIQVQTKPCPQDFDAGRATSQGLLVRKHPS